MVFLDYSLWPFVSEVSPVLNDNSWTTISRVSSSNEGENYWSVGDRKQVMLNGTVGNLSLSNYSIYVFIIGFNHNSSDEGTGRIHFQIGKTALSGGTDVCLVDNHVNTAVSSSGYFAMNGSRTSKGGWEESQMRTEICGTSLTSYSGTIIAAIPASLRSVLKSVVKYTDNSYNEGSSPSDVSATTDYFFLLSEFEVYGNIDWGNPYEANYQAQYAYYSAGNSIVKYRHNSTTTAVMWWLRSGDGATRFACADVGSFKRANIRYADYSSGFAPGFCV